AALPRPTPPAPARGRIPEALERLGRAAEEIARLLRDLTAYLGLFVLRLGAAIMRPRRLPLTALVHHCQQVGLNAVPIVVLMAFLIGVVLAFQGATQLRRFGADVFVVDLIAISVLRELGVLLTAIIVAGRTASAFTAQLGAMKMREEIDAMRTLAIDPAEALILPRVLALVITLPVLTLLANVAGLAGGALMAWIDLGISPAMFRTRLLETSVDHVTVGMLKAPVFAVVIGLIGCHAGMQVQGSTDSLGRLTSASVVRAIFAVILIDALFSIFYSEVGL
ncbi:MAG: MlaE family ABC transporter permease, partial [Gemmobacter sp.]